jgi:hypothetical protein
MASELTDLERELLTALAKLLAVATHEIEMPASRLRIKNKAKRLIKEHPLCPTAPGVAAPLATKTV